jgi:hypothetical protein
MQVRHWVWVLPLMQVSAACSDGGGKVCTAVGCLSFMRAQLELPAGMTKDDVTVTIEHSGRSFTCDFGAEMDPCHQGFQPDFDPAGEPAPAKNQLVVILNETPATLGVTVQSATGSETQQLEPVYQRSQPNGPDCQPTCLSSSSELQFGK